MKKTISAVIPNFNDSRIERAIASIVKQSIYNYELIIVEGCVDNFETKQIYEKYKTKIDILIHESDHGIFDALNKGIKQSIGDYIFLLGADDFLGDNEVFNSVADEIDLRRRDGYCIGAKLFESNNYVKRVWRPKSISQSKIKWGILPPHFSLFLLRDLYYDIGLFDLSMGNVAADSCWLLKMGLKNIDIKVLDKHYLYMEMGGTSTGSIKNILAAFVRNGMAAKKLGYWNWYIIPFTKVISKIPQYVAAKYEPERIVT